MQLPPNYIIAEGPEGLEKILNEFLEKANNDPLFASEEHFILYQLRDQQSLIKVNTKQIPFKFSHDDLMGRPATAAIRHTIAKFLWEKCGERERLQGE